MSAPLRVFVGWDKREAEAFEVCKYSLARRSSIPVDIRAIKLSEVRDQGLLADTICSELFSIVKIFYI